MVQVLKDFLVYIIGDVQITTTCSLMDVVSIICILLMMSFIISPCIKVFLGWRSDK